MSNTDAVKHAAALDHISSILAESGRQPHFTRLERVKGIEHMSVDILYKVIGIYAIGRGDSSEILPRICSGGMGNADDYEAVINSMYHFLPLLDTRSLTIDLLYIMLSNLPWNQRGFVNCALPPYREDSRILMTFSLASLGFPKPDDMEHRVDILLSSQLVETVLRHREEMDRVIDLYYRQRTPIGLLEERLSAHVALEHGAL